MREKCGDPCPGACGYQAECSVVNHTPMCTCIQGYVGDPFTSCRPRPVEEPRPVITDPCNPSPCGPNAQCRDGQCSCLAEFQGDPYVGCRPECVLSQDCPREKACIRQKCVDPCPNTCGQNAQCDVINHVPMCSCPPGFTGSPFIECRPYRGTLKLIAFKCKMCYILYSYCRTGCNTALHTFTLRSEQSVQRD